MESKIEKLILDLEEKIRRLTASVVFGKQTEAKIEAYENVISMLRDLL